jgi:TPR repeat protein
VKSSWDNPFPTFEAKETRRGSVEVGIGKDMTRLNISDKPRPGVIPERSHTSYSNRPGFSRPPVDVPHLPDHNRHLAKEKSGHGTGFNAQQDMSPSRDDSSKRQPGMPYADSGTPPRIMPLKKSATAPIPQIHSASQQQKPQYPGQAIYQAPLDSPPSVYQTDPLVQPPPRPFTVGGLRPINNSNQLKFDRRPHPSGYSHDRDASDDFLSDYFDSSEHPEGDEPDMPNFDAMPEVESNTRRGMIIDHHLISELEQLTKPVPAAPLASGSPNQYAAYKPEFVAQTHHAQPRPGLRGGNSPDQFENAGFQFGLLSETPPAPEIPRRISIGSQPPMRTYSTSPSAYEPRGPQQQHGGLMQTLQGNGPPRPYRLNEPEFVNDQLDLSHTDEAQGPAHHPSPFRPGLDQGSKPPPVRQYSRPDVHAGSPSQESPKSGPQDDSRSGPVTHEEIQKLQRLTRDNPNDNKIQLTLVKKLAEAASVLASEDGRVDPKTRNKNREKYTMDAYKILKKLAHSGYTEAMFYLADCYGQGLLGLEADRKEAFLLYQSAAKQGHSEAAYRLAVCCELGQEEGGGTKRDPLKAVQWYKRAAALGNTPAMYKMGVILLKGLLGQQKNPREALTWLKRAAERADKDNPHALHELALLYENASNNDIIIRDPEYAGELFVQAAELGYKFSQFRLGAAYEYGLMGYSVDARQSIIWYTRAAAQGEHQSELALSGWYLTGAEGILQQSDTEAYLWARKAASASLSKAEYAMGYFTEVGIGVPANLEDAKRWYWRAACKPAISNALEISTYLSSSQLKASLKHASASKTSRRAAVECRKPVCRVQLLINKTKETASLCRWIAFNAITLLGPHSLCLPILFEFFMRMSRLWTSF